MSTQPKHLLTPEEYLEIERNAELKSEYYRGEMFAMAGATEVHNLLVANLLRDLGVQFRSRPCRVYANDLRVRAGNSNLYTYPHVVALCGKPEFLDGKLDTLLNPNLLIEVLSPSREGYDRGLKFEMYRSIESLTEYLLVSSDRVHIDLYARQADGRWLLTSVSRPEESLELRSVACRIMVADVYEKLEFSE